VLVDSWQAVLRKLLEASSGTATAEAAGAQVGLMELLIALTPSLADEHVLLLWRAVRPHLQHSEAPLQKKAYKMLAALAEHHQRFVRERLQELHEAIDEALHVCHTTCKHKRLVCLHALVLQLSHSQLQHLLPALLGEVVLATKEPNVKTRAAAFDLLLGLAEQARRRYTRQTLHAMRRCDTRGAMVSRLLAPWCHVSPGRRSGAPAAARRRGRRRCAACW